jgi:hypothetical protein
MSIRFDETQKQGKVPWFYALDSEKQAGLDIQIILMEQEHVHPIPRNFGSTIPLIQRQSIEKTS